MPAARWREWCDAFADGNRGRSLSISLAEDQIGAETVAERVLKVAIDRDPLSTRTDIIISYGDRQSPSVHVLPAPVRIWRAQDANGVVVTLEIEDQNGRRTVLSFD